MKMTHRFQTSATFDADDSIFFERELTSLKSTSKDVLYPELKFAMGSIIPISREVDPGADIIMYEQYDKVGIAKLISNYADDLPRADIKGKEIPIKVHSHGASFGYNKQEIRAARLAKKNLPERRRNAALRAIDQSTELIAAFGNPETGINGFINHPNIQEYMLPNDGTGASTKFKDKTPDQVLRDLNAMATQVSVITKGVESPDTLLLPIQIWNDLTTRPRSATSDTTILEFFLKGSPHIKNVDWINQLSGAADNNVDDVIMMYKKDPDKLTLEIPLDAEQNAPEQRNLEFLINVEGRIAGVIIYYPLSVIKAQGAN